MIAAEALDFVAPWAVSIRIQPSVLHHFCQHVQNRIWSREAGGQLFAKVNGTRWEIAEATGPRRSDHRSRFSFKADREAEQVEILEMFDRGLHYVGDWHTHPQNVPHPSRTDIASIDDMVCRSGHSLPGFLMAIVGRDRPPSGLWISFHSNGGGFVRLKPSE